MAKSQGVLFDKRFLDSWVGSNILRSPRVAVIELIANSWDAGATRVKINWPDEEAGVPFSIEDNGEGMTDEQLNHRWRTLAYDRLAEQGATVSIAGSSKLPTRQVYGRNGVGRFAGFCFADVYYVETWRDGVSSTYRVARGTKHPLKVTRIGTKKKPGRGTRVYVDVAGNVGLSPEKARGEIGIRFLTDPNFRVLVDGRRVDFSHIPEEHIERFTVVVKDVGQIEVIAIDTRHTDRTTVRHGIAWHVNGRWVGECSWKGTGDEDLIDGRRIAAKRYTFIVAANCLADVVKKDWTGFDEETESYIRVAAAVHGKVQEFFQKVSLADRTQTMKKAQEVNRESLSRMSLRGVDKWKRFVEETQKVCPKIRQPDLI